MGTVGTTSKIKGFRWEHEWERRGNGGNVERNKYLNLCKQYHIDRQSTVVWQGAAYYPQAYELKFDYNGNTVHTAVLIDCKSNCLVYCKLEAVEN